MRNTRNSKKNTRKIKRKIKTRSKRKYFKKGGAPWRLTVNSYNELQKYLNNNTSWITPDTRIWVVKNTDNQALYESNSKDILESLFDHGITPQNISDYSFNIL